MFSIYQCHTSTPNSKVSSYKKGGPPLAGSAFFGDGVAVKGTEGPGLVYSLTSDSSSSRLVLDPIAMRLKRMSKTVKNSARLHTEDIQKGGYRFRCAMLTLTYAPGAEWQAKDITGLLKNIRDYMRRKGQSFRYVWVLELTKAQRPHYHVLIWLPKGMTLPKPDKRGWWSLGSTRIEWVKNPVGYIAKYASKGGITAAMPKGARIHGCGGLFFSSRLERAWWCVPAYVRAIWDNPALRVGRAKGGGWLAKATGDWMPSKYKIISFNPLIVELV